MGVPDCQIEEDEESDYCEVHEGRLKPCPVCRYESMEDRADLLRDE